MQAVHFFLALTLSSLMPTPLGRLYYEGAAIGENFAMCASVAWVTGACKSALVALAFGCEVPVTGAAYPQATASWKASTVASG